MGARKPNLTGSELQDWIQKAKELGVPNAEESSMSDFVIRDDKLEPLVPAAMRLAQQFSTSFAFELAFAGSVHPIVFASAVTAFLEKALPHISEDDRPKVAATIQGFLDAYNDRKA